MKILVISYPDLKKIYPQRPHQLISNLSKNHEVTVLSINAWWLPDIKDPYLDECLKNVRFIYPETRKYNPAIQELQFIRRYIRNNDFKDYNVIISFNDLIATYYISKTSRTPIVLDICDDIIKFIDISPSIPGILSPIVKSAGSYLLSNNIRKARKVTYTTNSIIKQYSKFTDNFVHVPNGVNTGLFKRSCNRKELALNNTDFIIGFTGFIGDWVELEQPLLALKMLVADDPKFKLLIVGSGNKLDEIKNLAKKYNLENNIIFTGNVIYSDVPRFTSCMDVCILPFKPTPIAMHAQPIKLFEYMASEKPVLSSTLTGVKDAVGDLVLFGDDAETIYRTIKKLESDSALRMQLGTEGRKYVENNYSWDVVCDKFEAIIEDSARKR